MMVNGYPIDQYPFPPSRVRFSTSSAFNAEEARIESGLSRAEFEALPGDPEWIDEDDPIQISKADVLVASYFRKLVEIVQSVEATKKR